MYSMSNASWFLTLSVIAAESPFQAGVRPTEPLTPAEQQRTFELPPGYEIQLFVAEPDIQKPMNMAFDAMGRLWLTASIEYPYAAEDGKGRDQIKILEDTDGDGRADKITTFADNLNIPMGIYPYRDGVVCYSVGNIWFMRDTDSDGKADVREVLYGPLGRPRDTHGMQTAFRRGHDGWLYICHGFANETTIRGKDGSQITLNSGNTYRVQLDGSRVEQYTWGQVNPFGSTWTPQGDLITADCHSHPLTLLLRGGYYSSFGKPHDGLGFVPPIMDHSHGSTAICGAAYLDGPHFGGELAGQLLVGNVMTSRVNRDLLEYHGSTVAAREAADFLWSTDPWFRPVDLQIAPDGALFISDFYNRIIGHYEVPLEHPARDRHRGRIWRVSRKNAPKRSIPDLALSNAAQLIEYLADPCPTMRMLATDQLSDRIGTSAVQPLRAAMRGAVNVNIAIHGHWILHRLNQLTNDDFQTVANHPNSLVRTHGQRMLSENSNWNSERRQLALAGLQDKDPFVQRAAADALGQHPAPEQVSTLLETLSAVSSDDILLKHGVRMAVRDQLRLPGVLDALRTASITADQRQLLADAALSIQSEGAAAFVIDYVSRGSTPNSGPRPYFAHAAANLPANQVGQMCTMIQERFRDDLDLQLELLTAIQQSVSRRGKGEPSEMKIWAGLLARQLLTSVRESAGMWHNEGVDNPWGLERRNTADGQRDVVFLSSLPGGEQKTAVLRSRPFEIPAQLTFYLCGHAGLPGQPASEANFVQLRMVDGAVVAKALPPRNDTAKQIVWDLKDHVGKLGVLEVVDGLNLGGYAWLAVSRFEPGVVSVLQFSPSQIAGRQSAAAWIAGTFLIADLRNELREMLLASTSDWRARSAAARAWTALSPSAVSATLAELIAENSVSAELRDHACRVIADEPFDRQKESLKLAMKTASTKVQRVLAQKLCDSAAGASLFLEFVEHGSASASLLQEEAFRQKLLATKLEGAASRMDKLTAALPPLNTQIQATIDARRKAFAAASPVIETGRELFVKHCANCHQVQGKGSLIGPQLDGIGIRGIERILEDVLDPARNVDIAFQTSVIALNNGRVVNGLVRREEGNALILANYEGKEIAVLKTDIDEHSKSPASIMPANVGELISPGEFSDLLGYLGSLKQAEKKE